jgi:hypothetical protein
MVAWNPSGLHVLTALLRGVKFSVGYYTTERLERIKIGGTAKELTALEN